MRKIVYVAMGSMVLATVMSCGLFGSQEHIVEQLTSTKQPTEADRETLQPATNTPRPAEATNTPRPAEATNTPRPAEATNTPRPTEAPMIRAKDAKAGAQLAFEEWSQQNAVPYRDVSYEVLSSDGTFAVVYVTAWFRESPDSEWVQYETEVDCKNVGGNWQCDAWMYFEEVYVPPPPAWWPYLTRVWVGEETTPIVTFLQRRYQAPFGPKEGWKYVLVEVVFENAIWGWNTEPLPSGILLDSEGYEREIGFSASRFGKLGVGAEHLVPSSFRLAALGFTEIPEAFDPSLVLIYMPNGETVELDPNNPTETLQLPIEADPTTLVLEDLIDGWFWSLYLKEVGDSFIFPGEMEVTVEDLELTNKTGHGVQEIPGSAIVIGTLAFENIGGEDIRGGMIETAAIDDRGQFSGFANFSIGLDDDGLRRGIIAPGHTAVRKYEMDPFFYPPEDAGPKIIWQIIFVEGRSDTQVGIFKVEKD